MQNTLDTYGGNMTASLQHGEVMIAIYRRVKLTGKPFPSPKQFTSTDEEILLLMAAKLVFLNIPLTLEEIKKVGNGMDMKINDDMAMRIYFFVKELNIDDSKRY